MSKYHNQRVIVDGKPFASILESRRYGELKFMKKAGIITEFQEQPRYLLQEAFRKNGVLHRAIHYVGDFLVTYPDGHQELEDVKGRFITPEFRIKQKLFEKRYPDLTIRIVGGKTKRKPARRQR